MTALRLVLLFLALFVSSSPGFAALSPPKEPDLAGDAAGSAPAAMEVEIGAGSSAELAVEKEDRAPPPVTPQSIKPRQSIAE
ncbi:MAG: hypothetical protein JO245_04825 [Pseudolabrys sp.]|nr:hypothetical protein [Pseudolabrys sp.]